MQEVSQFIHDSFGLNPEFQTKILKTIVVIVVLSVIRLVVTKIIWRQTDDVKTRYTWRKSLAYATIFLIIIFIARIWFQAFQTIGTFLGLLSAGIAIALKDLLANIAAWIFIIVRRPFSMGDRIQVGNHAGDVIDIRAYMFTILEIGNWVHADQSTGRIIHLPNAYVFTRPVCNYTKGFQFLWHEIEIVLTFESNWQKAKHILNDVAHELSGNLSEPAKQQIKAAASKFMIYYNKLTPIVYTKVVEYGVRLTIRYLSHPRKRRGTEELFWERILIEFEKHKDITFAYPTQRFYNHYVENTAVNDMK